MDLIQEYREVEKKSRDRYKARMERQYKIVKPDASEAEIKQAIETDQGSQVFANALTQSTRYADARNAYREVQERHEDIKKIAQTMTELQDLFNDMAMLVSGIGARRGPARLDFVDTLYESDRWNVKMRPLSTWKPMPRT